MRKEQPLSRIIAFCMLAISMLPEVSGTEAAVEPQHERLLQLVRESDSVLPPVLKTHPVNTVYNREAVVPPQCYTKTEARANPCYVCHQDQRAGRENAMNDRDLQEAYSFSDLGMTNHWKNLFEDRRERVERVTDEEILRYISEDNYSELPERLREAGFKGYIPDLKNLHLGAAAFDEHGFALDGSDWVAFNYKPFPSTFWPTNGSTDDVMIRLPKAFRSDAAGKPSRDVYRANLAILEALIKGVNSMSCLPVDEAALDRDLNGDQQLTTVDSVNRLDDWVGGAAGQPMETHLYPEGTEFLHTVRYVGVDEEGRTTVSVRMKEVRYMWKARGYGKTMYARKYEMEAQEKEAGNLPGYMNIGDHGLDNGNGWAIRGFIEDRRGRLRGLTYEENFSCMGCHNSVGSTIDKTFSFARKVDGASGWGYINLKGMPDAPSAGETRGEILTYLERAAGGSEFRNNEEMAQKWFTPDGSVDEVKVRAARDVFELITPSRDRALKLNKAYKLIVEDQDFIHGKDGLLVPPVNVYHQVDNKTAPRLPADRVFDYNIILDWPRGS